MTVAMLALAAPPVLAQDTSLSDARVLGSDATLHVESVTTRITGFDQWGHGYQSKAGPILGPGSERLTVFEPQAEIVATQGDRITHRVWVPIDMVTAASPHANQQTPDVMTGASRKLEGGTLQWTTAYRTDPASQLALTSGLHLENPFRSWN